MRFLLQAAMAIGRRVAQQQQQHLGIGAQAVFLAWLRTGGWAIYHFAIFKTCHTWRCKMSKHATPCVAQMVSHSKYTVCCSCMARRTKPPLRLIGIQRWRASAAPALHTCCACVSPPRDNHAAARTDACANRRLAAALKNASASKLTL